MNQDQIKNIIEAALMASDRPLAVPRLQSLFEGEMEQPEREQIRAALEHLQEEFANRGIELKEVANGFRFQVRSEFAPWVNHLFDERPPRYSRALMETLAIVAYRQPITRGEIEDIRGVSVASTIIKTLQEREWIRVVGHRDIPGKPELLATTKTFLDYFNLKSLSDLPALAEIKDFDAIYPDLFDGIEDDTTEDPTDPQDERVIASAAMPDQKTAMDEDSGEGGDDDGGESAVTTTVVDDVNAKVIPFSS